MGNLSRLAEEPFRFAQMEAYAHRGYRRRIHCRYTVIYRIDETEIIIVRVLSSFVDMDEALKN